ncbi:hypothetical protein TNCV_1249101 [Trichonephila clavipes]|nr:hypothetical protein TNCV_1249101 [Trichonephila clavipes]
MSSLKVLSVFNLVSGRGGRRGVLEGGGASPNHQWCPDKYRRLVATLLDFEGKKEKLVYVDSVQFLEWVREHDFTAKTTDHDVDETENNSANPQTPGSRKPTNKRFERTRTYGKC